MEVSIFNSYKGFLYLILTTLLFSCGVEANNASGKAVPPPPPPPPPLHKEGSSTTKENFPQSGTLQFQPSSEDQKKYNTVKSILQEHNEIFLTQVRSGRLSKYRSLTGLNSRRIINTSELINLQNLNSFLTQQSMDKAAFDFEMNNIGSALGFSLIEDFGNSKDQGKYMNMSIEVKKLIRSGMITNIEELRAKMFQAEMNSKFTPTSGNENLKIEVGNDGKVHIKQ